MPQLQLEGKISSSPLRAFPPSRENEPAMMQGAERGFRRPAGQRSSSGTLFTFHGREHDA